MKFLYLLSIAFFLSACVIQQPEPVKIDTNKYPLDTGAGNISFLRMKGAADHYNNRYKKMGYHKAFAQSKAGPWGFYGGLPSTEQAMQEALNDCRKHNTKYERGEPCRIVNLDGHWGAQLPSSVLHADDGWTLGTLQDAGFDMEKMQLLDQELESGVFPRAHMVVIEYDGKLVYEKYLAGNDESWGDIIPNVQFDQNQLHDLRSISKSVTSLLLGIALGNDFEVALSRPIIEYFPEFTDQMSPGAEKVTLAQILTMSAGFEWNQMDVSWNNNDAVRMNRADDPVQFLFGKPLKNEPGKHWYYNGGTTMVLAALVAEISGQNFLEFAQEKLFGPLAINPSNIEWWGLGNWQRQLPSAGAGLRMRARDLAKIGSLMLHDGQWQGKQVVPRKWIHASSQRHMEQTYPKWSSGGVYGYGYQWWHGEFKKDWGKFTAITGVGYGGQRLFIVPEKKLVVTVFAGNYNNPHYSMAEWLLSSVIDAAP
jgi:CubicO group peptidase (beta-lactamase class C family)